MAYTLISDLWVPSIWVDGVEERVRTFPSLLTAGGVTRSPLLDQIASGPGTTANVPFFKDSTEGADVIQVENTDATINAITSGLMVAPILNRESAIGGSALSAQVSGKDPVDFALRQLALRRLKQRLTTAINLMRGVFGTALSANSVNNFVEIVGSQTSAHFITSDMFTDAYALLGELGSQVLSGMVFMHPTIRANLVKADNISFERDSVLGLTLERYRGLQVVVSNKLSRAGTTSGTVYDTYLIGAGSIAYGEKPQVGDVIDVASLQMEMTRLKNNIAFIDRTRFLMHIDGTRWTGTAAGQSATNAELATAGNWSLVYQNADRCAITRIQTNG